jgi:predicted RNA-binding protein YlqC (UPF0109 family)
MPDYAKLVGEIVRHLVRKPEEVQVDEGRSDAGAVLVTIRVASEDVGRVIGKRGSTIGSIRILAKAAAVKSGEKIDVDIEEDRESLDEAEEESVGDGR